MFSDSDIRDILGEVAAHGYCDLGVDSKLELLFLAGQLGKPVPILPGEPELGTVGGRGNSDRLSAREYAVVYHDRSIPPHTDAAYYRTPPRIGMLRLKPTSSSNRPTILLNPLEGMDDRKQLSVLWHSLWKIHSGGRLPPFAGRLLETHRSGYFLRYDMNCMKPYFSRHIAAMHTMERLVAKADKHEIDWQPGQTVVWDNWRLLHGSGAICNTDDPANRVLERVLIETETPGERR